MIKIISVGTDIVVQNFFDSTIDTNTVVEVKVGTLNTSKLKWLSFLPIQITSVDNSLNIDYDQLEDMKTGQLVAEIYIKTSGNTSDGTYDAVKQKYLDYYWKTSTGVPSDSSAITDENMTLINNKFIDVENDINIVRESIPTKTSQLTNDVPFLTKHQSLVAYALKSDLPTRVSQLDNDAGYLNQHQDLSGKQDVIEDLQTIRENAELGKAAAQSLEYYAPKDTIPTKITDLVDDSSFVTDDSLVKTLESYTKTEDMPTKVSQFENDSSYLTPDTLDDYATILDIPTRLSQLVNDISVATTDFIDEDIKQYEKTWSKTVNDLDERKVDTSVLDEYYTKTEVDGKHYLTSHQSLVNYYTKEEILDLVGSKYGLSITTCLRLPDASTADPHTIYFLETIIGDNYNNAFEEWMCINGKWEILGKVEANLSDYYTKEDTSIFVDNALVKYQQKISDLDDIREGAALGKTSVQTSALDDYALKTSIPTKVGQLSNDSSYVSLGQMNETLAQYATVNDTTILR